VSALARGLTSSVVIVRAPDRTVSKASELPVTDKKAFLDGVNEAKALSTVGSRYQRDDEEKQTGRTRVNCRQTEWSSDSAADCKL
jgi:hypothetical protein